MTMMTPYYGVIGWESVKDFSAYEQTSDYVISQTHTPYNQLLAYNNNVDNHNWETNILQCFHGE